MNDEGSLYGKKGESPDLRGGDKNCWCNWGATRMLPPMGKEVEEIVFRDTKRGDNECDNLPFTHTLSITFA